MRDVGRSFLLSGRMRPVIAVALSVLALAAGSARVNAECNPPGDDPSFRRAAPLARVVVAGTVTAVHPDGLDTPRPPGSSFRFTLAIEHQFRGEVPSPLVVDFLETEGCVRWISAAVGDVIALALDVDQTDPGLAANTAAWIEGRTGDYWGFESITLAELSALFIRPPDTSTDPGPYGADRLALVVVATVASTLVGWWAWWRRDRARSRPLRR